jgi:pimeloyl-ACP methyl ester carboxylesterase
MGGGVALGFALQAPDRVERLALINSACLDDAMLGGWMAWFLVHILALNVIGWWFLRSSRHLMRWALLREMRYRPDLVTPMLVDELMRLARKRRAGAAFSSGNVASSADPVGLAAGLERPKKRFKRQKKKAIPGCAALLGCRLDSQKSPRRLAWGNSIVLSAQASIRRFPAP